ncbi:hypothetical protein F2P81_011321 [Scophthalmus maximus]|uniref:Uncharacterized protein n=1 Tax=Scophthalmus maximus TaxID=52904 RepID=A0A6A4STI6_SCOMX|nr:hypothetical protein F2P81_011321 [Scophthalmus maximus]
MWPVMKSIGERILKHIICGITLNQIDMKKKKSAATRAFVLTDRGLTGMDTSAAECSGNVPAFVNESKPDNLLQLR